MGMQSYTNIVVGEANLWLAAATVAYDWNAIGGTQEGIELSWEPNMVEVEVDQFGDAARVIQSKIKVMIKTSLAEITLANLAVVWGYTGAFAEEDVAAIDGPGVRADGVTLNVGIHGATPEERRLTVCGPAAGHTAQDPWSRVFTATRVVSYETSAGSWQRNENYKLPVNFRVLPDQDQTGKEYGTIVDSNVDPYTYVPVDVAP